MKAKHLLFSTVSLLTILSLAGCGTTESSSASSASSSSSPATSSSSPSPSSPASSESVSSDDASSNVSSTTSSVAQSYRLVAGMTEGVEVTFDRSEAKEGDVVTVTATVTDATKAFSSFSTDGNDVAFKYTVREDGKGVATFTMPARDVTVSAILDVRTVRVADVENYVDGVTISVEEGAEFVPGSTVDVTLTAEDPMFASYNIDKYYFCVNGVPYKPALPEDAQFSQETASVSFTMPEEDATIVFLLTSNVLSDDGHAISFEPNDGVEVYGYAADEKYGSVGGVMAVRQDGYAITGVEYSVDGGAWQTYSLSALNDAGYAVFIDMDSLSGDTAFRFTTETATTHTITYVGLENVEYNPGTRLPIAPDKGVEGDVISLKNLVGGDGYTFAGEKAAELTGVPEGNVEANEAPASEWSSGELTFTMPDADVTVTFDLKGYGKVLFEENEDLESTCAIAYSYETYGYEQIESAKPGTSFYAVATPKEGYVVTSFTLNGDTRTANATSYSYADFGSYMANFTMPSDGSDAVVTVNTSKAYSVSADTYDEGSIAFERTTYGKGETVEFTFEPTEPADAIDEIHADGYEDDAIQLKYDQETKKGSFVMPEGNVHLTLTFKKLPTTTVAVSFDEEAQKVVSSIRVTGTQSKASLTEMEATDLTFIVGEYVNISGSINYQYQHQYSLAIEATVGGATITQDLEISYSSISGSFVVPEGLTAVKLVATKNEPYKVTYDIPEGVEVSYTAGSNYDVDSLDGLVYPGMDFDLEILTPAPEGQMYVVTVTETESKKVVPYDYGYTPEADFTIAITLTEAKTISWTVEGGTEDSYFYGSITSGTESEYISSYAPAGTMNVGKGASFTITATSYYFTNVKVTIGEEVVYNQAPGEDMTFQATDDVQIVLTAAESIY